MQIAVTIPTYNEKENILPLLAAVHQHLPEAQILVVDDSSPDGTAQLVRDFMTKNTFVSLLQRKAKEGLGAAYVDGFSRLISEGYDQIFQMDADFSHDPACLPQFLEQLNSGARLVIGSRYVRGGRTENWGVIRKLTSRGGSLYAATILGLALNDVTGGFKCWNASLLAKVIKRPLLLKGFGFQIEMNYRAHLLGARICEIPIVFADREKGYSKMSRRIFVEALQGVIRLRRKGSSLVE